MRRALQSVGDFFDPCAEVSKHMLADDTFGNFLSQNVLPATIVGNKIWSGCNFDGRSHVRFNVVAAFVLGLRGKSVPVFGRSAERMLDFHGFFTKRQRAEKEVPPNLQITSFFAQIMLDAPG